MTTATIYAILFWFSVSVLFYTYIGYGLLLYIWTNIFHRREVTSPAFIPEVTLIVAAYNEEDFIEKKIENSLGLDYPAEKLNFLFITDGSSDNSPAIVKRFAQIQLLHQPERKGKAAALNRAIQFVKTPVVIFTDANTLLNKECIRNIVRHYNKPKTGGVAGEKKVIAQNQASAVETGEGTYWQYESLLKKLDAEFYTVVGAAGEIFSIRTELFRPLKENTITDDFMISMNVCGLGYRVAYEPKAYAIEAASASMKEEAKRKIRISAGNFQALGRLKKFLNPFYNPRLFFQYVSRRVLRWVFCPLSLIIAFFSNLWLFVDTDKLFYHYSFYLQCAFYLMAFTGWILANKKLQAKIFYIPYYFVFMNAATFAGLVRFARGKQTAVWEKAARKKLA
jgi:biofilm PGA synthesis N-glycosyltransferase PgaC